jgi:hypothetical protein
MGEQNVQREIDSDIQRIAMNVESATRDPWSNFRTFCLASLLVAQLAVDVWIVMKWKELNQDWTMNVGEGLVWRIERHSGRVQALDPNHRIWVDQGVPPLSPWAKH